MNPKPKPLEQQKSQGEDRCRACGGQRWLTKKPKTAAALRAARREPRHFWEELCAVFGVLKRRIGSCKEVVAVLGCKYFRVMFGK